MYNTFKKSITKKCYLIIILMNIFIKTLENKYMITVNDEETVLSLKYQIDHNLNIKVQR